jgi:hypothetical protein
VCELALWDPTAKRFSSTPFIMHYLCGRTSTQGVSTQRSTMDQGTQEQRVAWLHLDSWAGRSRHRVTVVAETPKRYRVRWDDEPVLRRQRGRIHTVPRYAVTFEQCTNE